MKKLDWNDKFSIGITEIDDQHKKLINIINMMNDVFEGNLTEKTSLKIVLLEMEDYIQYHFKSEEDFMQIVNYPDFASHKKEHNDFIITVKNFVEQLSENRDIAKDLLIFLYNWLSNHILNVDQKIGQYMNKNQ
jgi:hemerythrin